MTVMQACPIGELVGQLGKRAGVAPTSSWPALAINTMARREDIQT